MTEPDRNLAKKPLVEAILEIKWDLAGKGDPAHPLFAGALAGIVADYYPTHERLPAAEVPDEFTPYIVKFRMRPRDAPYPLVQAGPGIVSLNSLDEYTWDLYKTRALHLWDSLHKAYPPFNEGSPPRVTSAVLKYINSHPTRDTDPQQFLRESLHTTVSLPEQVAAFETAGAPTGVGMFLDYPLQRGDTKGTVRIQSGMVRDASAVLWELTTEAKFAIPVDRETFSEWLDYSHGVIDKWFFSLIEGDLEDDFRGQVRHRG